MISSWESNVSHAILQSRDIQFGPGLRVSHADGDEKAHECNLTSHEVLCGLPKQRLNIEAQREIGWES